MSRAIQRAIALASLIGFLAACGPSDEPPPPAEETADASTVKLALALDLPDTLRRAVEIWASERRARVEWAAPDALDGATLAEIDAVDLVRRTRAGALRPLPDAAAQTQWLAACGRDEGRTWGVPWRAALTALVSDVAPTWPELARRGDSVVLVEGEATNAFLALAAASGAGPPPGETHDLDPRDEAAVEALAFLRRLAVRARTVAPDEAFPEGTTAAVAGTAQRDLLPGRLRPWAFPGPESADDARVVARPRLLVVPATGDHGDLGAELARWLAAPERAALLHGDPARGLALHRDVADEGPLGAWLALRPVACLPPTDAVDAAAWNATLAESVRAAMERRRSPEAALDEAWTRR